MGKLQDFQKKICWNEDMFMNVDIPVDIFHYTSPAGFESILFGNKSHIELWASRYDCLNDASEGTVALERYKSVCNSMLETQEITKELYDILVSIKTPHTTLMWHCKEGTDILTRPEYVRYVCSFSKNSDSLAMWNYYSKGSKYEGFNLGFYSQTLVESIEQQLKPYESKVRLYPIVYDCTQQESLIRDFVLKMVEHYEIGDEAILRYMVSNQLLQWSLVFKKDYFKHEEEVRLIVDVGVKKFESQEEIPQMITHYRIVNGYTIPYIKLRFEKYCLSYVTLGPLTCDVVNKDLQISVMEDRISSEGYDAIVNSSSIPVRY